MEGEEVVASVAVIEVLELVEVGKEGGGCGRENGRGVWC